jgi:hypothetical protein
VSRQREKSEVDFRPRSVCSKGESRPPACWIQDDWFRTRGSDLMAINDDGGAHWIAQGARDLAVRAFRCVHLNEDTHTREHLTRSIFDFERRLEAYANDHRIPLSDLRRWAFNLRQELIRSPDYPPCSG